VFLVCFILAYGIEELDISHMSLSKTKIISGFDIHLNKETLFVNICPNVK